MKENLENSPNLEDNSPDENPLETVAKRLRPEDLKKISRREFLKTAGLAGGTLAAGIGGGIIAGKIEKREDREHIHQGEGIVVEKIDKPGWEEQGPLMPAGGPVPILVPGPPVEYPESFSVKVKVNEKVYAANISKEEFDALAIGEKVSLKYDDRDMTASTVEKAK